MAYTKTATFNDATTAAADFETEFTNLRASFNTCTAAEMDADKLLARHFPRPRVRGYPIDAVEGEFYSAAWSEFGAGGRLTPMVRDTNYVALREWSKRKLRKSVYPDGMTDNIVAIASRRLRLGDVEVSDAISDFVMGFCSWGAVNVSTHASAGVVIPDYPTTAGVSAAAYFGFLCLAWKEVGETYEWTEVDGTRRDIWPQHLGGSVNDYTYYMNIGHGECSFGKKFTGSDLSGAGEVDFALCYSKLGHTAPYLPRQIAFSNINLDIEVFKGATAIGGGPLP